MEGFSSMAHGQTVIAAGRIVFSSPHGGEIATGFVMFTSAHGGE